MAPKGSIKRRVTRNSVIGSVTLVDLPDMTRAQLCDTWARVVGKPVIRGASRELLLSAIAWHLQARQHGGLSPAVQRKLERLAAAIDRGESVRPTASDRLRPGMSLERAWRDETHSVTVLADGFAYRGQRYRSLSQIARRITGTRWNGPAFFGLRQSNGKVSVGSDDAR
jgi:Protein of unknown function (DUF2924)